jgi:hypothetical protein
MRSPSPHRAHSSGLLNAKRRRRKTVARHTAPVLPTLAQSAVDDLLMRLDRAVPRRIEGFYVVGSASMGAFRPGRSDVDFVAIVNGEFRRAELARLRSVHLSRWTWSLVHDVAGRRRWPLVCNGCYLRPGDLSRSAVEVTPLAGHVAGRFRVAGRDGFGVNPVTWHVLAHHGIAIRGPERDQLQIHTDDAELRTWTLANLNSYWPRWAERTRRGGLRRAMALTRRSAAWGVLGVPRLHYTIVHASFGALPAIPAGLLPAIPAGLRQMQEGRGPHTHISLAQPACTVDSNLPATARRCGGHAKSKAAFTVVAADEVAVAPLQVGWAHHVARQDVRADLILTVTRTARREVRHQPRFSLAAARESGTA